MKDRIVKKYKNIFHIEKNFDWGEYWWAWDNGYDTFCKIPYVTRPMTAERCEHVYRVLMRNDDIAMEKGGYIIPSHCGRPRFNRKRKYVLEIGVYPNGIEVLSIWRANNYFEWRNSQKRMWSQIERGVLR